MRVERLILNNVRIIQSAQLNPHPVLNVIDGKNASGKTTILEAIHLLGSGRSFRTHKVDTVIQQGSDELSAFAEIAKSDGLRHRLGILKRRGQPIKVKVDGSMVTTSSQLAATLPVQVVSPESNILLNGGPKFRRAYLDWGLFHVEHRFHEAWRRYERALKQRNTLLRNHSVDSVRAPWDQEILQHGNEIHQVRQPYSAHLADTVQDTFRTLFGSELELDIRYQQGWKSGRSLEESIALAQERDKEVGFTQVGPHRADWKLIYRGQPAEVSLSRGQQKLLIIAMKVAQIVDFAERTGHTPVVLFDDLVSELDKERRQSVLSFLIALGAQLFVTGTDANELLGESDSAREFRMFHVEQGQLQEVV